MMPVDIEARCLECGGRMIITNADDGELIVLCVDCGAEDPIEDAIDEL